MIEMIWNDSNPPLDARVFKLKDFNQFIMAAEFEYDADDVKLSTYEHKNVLIRLHNANDDHMFSIEQYHKQIMIEFADKITNSLLNKSCLVIVKAPENEYIIPTDFGRSVYSGLAHLDLSEDELRFLEYLISEAEPLNLLERYGEDEIEIIESDETDY